jgi:hypothetical protein
LDASCFWLIAVLQYLRNNDLLIVDGRIDKVEKEMGPRWWIWMLCEVFVDEDFARIAWIVCEKADVIFWVLRRYIETDGTDGIIFV